MKNASLRQLQIFVSLAKTGNMSRTAKELHMTQSGVTQHLKLLEHASKVVLFDRLPRQLRLTQIGAQLLPYAAQVLASMKELVDNAAICAGQVGGHLRLAAVSSCKYFVPNILAQFLAQDDRIIPQLMLANRELVLEALLAMDVDVAITGRPPEKNPQIESHAFAPNTLILVTHPDYLKTRKASKIGQKNKTLVWTEEQLSQAVWLIRERGSGTREALERYWKAHHLKPNLVIEINSIESIKQSVMANLGISLLSQSAVKHELAQGRLAIAHAVGLPIERDWYLLTLKGRTQGPAAKAFMRFVHEKGAEFI